MSNSNILAVLLPLTAKKVSPESFLQSLKSLCNILPPPSQCAVYVGIDSNDEVLMAYFDSNRDCILKQAFVSYIDVDRFKCFKFEPESPAPICRIANELAMEAFKAEGYVCEWFILLGDDVSITTVNPTIDWLTVSMAKFDDIASRMKNRNVLVPRGFGVVALPDSSFPGFPSFPMVGRAHINIFGHLFPFAFINQDGDPYLWEIYRPFGANIFADGVMLTNGVGGDVTNPCRYVRTPLTDWKYDVLSGGIKTILKYLTENLVKVGMKDNEAEKCLEDGMLVTIDVITPTFRGNMELLRRIVSLPVPENSSVHFIIIVDDPKCSSVKEDLQSEYSDGRVRIRVNDMNKGASASRNRGIFESSSTWNLFLDDDVIPDPWILHAYVNAIRSRGDEASGFVGLTRLPTANTYLTAALHMSYLTYFWTVATNDIGGDRAPWAVTANAFARRGKTRFDLEFSKTGGGEDIAYLQGVEKEFGLPQLKWHTASASHPWWNNGYPDPWRFYGWAVSDSLLMKADKFPERGFYSWPNAVECTFLILVWMLVSLRINHNHLVDTIYYMGYMLSILWLAEIFMDVFRCMIHDPNVVSDVKGSSRLLCSILACVYKNFSELGHMMSCIKQRNPLMFCRRFDWWFGINKDYINEKRSTDFRRLLMMLVAILAVWQYGPMVVVVYTLMFIVIVAVVVSFTMPTSVSPLRVAVPPIANEAKLSEAVDCINVVFIATDSYCKHLAVAIRSLLDRSPGIEMKIMVVNFDISEQNWNRIKEIFNEQEHATVESVSVKVDNLCPEALYPKEMRKEWGTWGKLWLDDILLKHDSNIVRVIYLDCDVIFRTSIKDLWDTYNTAESSVDLLAVRDIGYPMGRDDLNMFGWNDNTSYFNAGVLVFNPSVWKTKHLGDAMRAFARDFALKGCMKYKDQDVLNIIFRGRWQKISFKFNVQGMGTYGDHRVRSKDARDSLYSADEWNIIQQEAVIVHFTGVNHPSIMEFLNRDYKMATKPNAWFCHHPLQDAYHDTLKRTAFNIDSDGMVDQRNEQLNHALSDLFNVLAAKLNIASSILMEKVSQGVEARTNDQL